jgi:hypothetical protein
MRTRRRAAIGVSACLLLTSLVLGTAPSVAAATLLVDDDNAQCPAATFTTIQAAVTAASPGDTVQVCAGNYPELAPGPLTINKSLTLEGAQAGNDARSRAGAESIISDIQGTSVAASGVVIDGFTVQNSTFGSFTGYGIWINPGISGTNLVNDIIQNNIIGIGLANAGASQAVIRHNLIQNNNQPGSATGTGIYTDQFAGGSIVRNVVIDENTFLGHGDGGAAISISNTDFAVGGVFDLTVTDNLFDTNNRAFVLFNTHDSTFDGNTIRNSTFAGSGDVRLFSDNSGLRFTNNNLSDGLGMHAVRIGPASAFPNSDVEFHYNNFERYGVSGMTVDAGAYVGTVNAACNWWNSSSGPTDPIGNPGGTGEKVFGSVDYTPWLIARAPNGPCIGGKASTPGKVTGGGQTPGTDPTFSASGSLLTPPALVPSATGPTGTATFGFVASCCRAKGNLEYNDHNAGVRIKAKSIDALFIGDGSCGPNTHAQFVGTAYVYRSTGTTTESFTVDVDDCGEPGTLDTFGITTDSYSNGPSVLLGGNIQIHR